MFISYNFYKFNKEEFDDKWDQTNEEIDSRSRENK